jgi:CRP/FNR family cyclic AMP-dependent transcriptional regulator
MEHTRRGFYDRRVRNRSLLAALPPVEAERLRRTAVRRVFASDAMVVRQGDAARSLHLVVRGRVAVMVTCGHGHQLTFMIAGPGDTFGELALLGGGEAHECAVRALEETETMAVSRGDYEACLRRHPQFGELVARKLAERVLRLAVQLQEVACVPVEQRVRRRLVELVDLYGRDATGTVIPLTQQDVAALAGTARGTVNRVLRQEEALGSLLIGRHRLTVLDAPALSRRAAAG